MMAREPRYDLSMYRFSDVLQDADGNAYLEDAEPVAYEDRLDNIPHVVQEGDTLDTLAQYYYWNLDVDASQLWWVIAGYQPVPIINPFVPLRPGKLIILPSP